MIMIMYNQEIEYLYHKNHNIYCDFFLIFQINVLIFCFIENIFKIFLIEISMVEILII